MTQLLSLDIRLKKAFPGERQAELEPELAPAEKHRSIHPDTPRYVP